MNGSSDYTLQADGSDPNGISISGDFLGVPSGASIEDQTGGNAVTAHAALPAQIGHTLSTAGGL